MSMECRRQRELDVGGGRGVQFSDNSVKTGKWSDGEHRVVETDGVREVSDDEMTRSRV